jgi:L-rhamnose mutarotase
LRRFAQVIKLHAKDEEEYIRCHEQVWPEVLQTISACGIRNYSIFLRSGLLFSYFEYHGHDYAADMKKMEEDPATQAWWRITDPMQTSMDDAAPGEKWSDLREVFHLGDADVVSPEPLPTRTATQSAPQPTRACPPSDSPRSSCSQDSL